MPASRNQLDGEITTILPGIAIYKTRATPFYQARIRINKKYVTRSTREKSKIKAREAAIELARELNELAPKVAGEDTFKAYALKWLVRATDMVERGERNASYARTERLCIENEAWGLLKHFGHMDVRNIKTRNFLEYRDALRKRRPDITASTHGTIQACFRNVMKCARDDGLIESVPQTPRVRQNDTPRTFFRFKPLVSKEEDEYHLLRKVALEMATEGKKVRGVPVTGELYDIILFLVHSFIRPMTTELYALRHKHITIADEPKRLIVTVPDGKTGYRVANTMPGAVSAYHRIRQRYPHARPDDFLFLPDYKNRETASRIMQRQFNELLARTGLKFDPVTNTSRSMYCLRHTAICLRIIKSEGKVNIYNLAKTAGTSVDQIERFYTYALPASAEMARNLQSMGD